MSETREQIVASLARLIGLKLTSARRAADLRTFQFGPIRQVDGGSVGEYALHIQCPWRIEADGAILTGQSDLWEPDGVSAIDSQSWDYETDGNRQDARIGLLLGSGDPAERSLANSGGTLVVEEVDADAYGGATLSFSGGCRLRMFPDGTAGEAWRIFRPASDEPHFVMAMQVEAADPYFKLRPPAPTASEGICSCPARTPLVLQSHLSPNPLACARCNLEVPPEAVGFDAELAEAIATWRTLHDCFYFLWLDSREFEVWAAGILQDPVSRVNTEGRDLARRLGATRRCYLWWFQDEGATDWVPATNCPCCAKELVERFPRERPSGGSLRVCEECLVAVAA